VLNGCKIISLGTMWKSTLGLTGDLDGITKLVNWCSNWNFYIG